MKCTKCGAEQEADVKFCTQCGAPMEHEDQTPENNGPEPADKEPASGAEAVKSEPLAVFGYILCSKCITGEHWK